MGEILMDRREAIERAIKAMQQLERAGVPPDIRNLSISMRKVFEEVRQKPANEAEIDVLASGVTALATYVKKHKGTSKYDTDTFKCLSDYRLCCDHEPIVLCATLVAVCLAGQIIPLAGGG